MIRLIATIAFFTFLYFLTGMVAGEMSNGTHLADWGEPLMNSRMIRDLGFLNITSVEDLSAVSDSHIQKIIDGRMWRSKAIAWLAAHPKPEEESEVAKLKAANEALMKRLDALEKKSSPAMKAKMSQLRAKKNKPRGSFLAELDAKKAADVG